MSIQSHAQQTAFNYLTDFYADDDGKISLPVDPVKIVTQAGVNVSVADLNDAAGVLVHDSESTRMFLDRSNANWVSAFVAAQLFGRHVYNSESRHGFVAQTNTLFSRPDTEEGEFAEKFAYELLLPGSAVRKFWAKGKSIKWISNHFGFSRRIIENRLIQLGLV